MPAALAAMLVAAMGGGAMAQQPENWGMGLQAPATVGMVEIEEFHDLLLVIIVVITLFVTALLGYVMWRFRASRNPTPSQTSHNTLIEVLWTIIPVIILVIIAIPSFNLLYFLDRTEEAEMTVKANGHQWYWSYEYPDHGNFSFASNMLPEDQLEADEPFMLAVDNPMVVPVDTNIRLLVAGQDVIHAFGLPSFGLKLDAVPGRLNETWFKALETGVFYGQCSEICGVNHGYMPIEIRVVSKDEFAQWVEQRQAEYGIAPEATAVAAAE